MVEEKVREGYKRTEVGVIPEDWQLKSIEELGLLSKGAGIRKNQADSGDIPCIRYGELYTKHSDIIRSYNSMINKEVAETSRRIKQGDILFAGSGETKEEIGKCAAFIDDIEAYAGGDIIILSPDKGFSNFYGYIFNSPSCNKQKASKGQGDAIVHISSTNLSKVLIPYPPLKEQEAIANVLSDTDDLITTLQKLIDKKEKIKKGAMQKLLTGEERLPGFDEEWEEKELGDIVSYENGKAHENFVDKFGNYIVVNSKFISTEGKVIKYTKTPKMIAKKNDILMVMSDVPNGRAIAKCFLVNRNKKYSVNQRICLLRSNGANPIFLYYKIDRNSYYLSFDDGVKQTNLRKDDVLGCKLKVPKIEEQKAIAQILSDMDAEIEALNKKLEKYKKIKQGMMEELLTGRIRLV